MINYEIARILQYGIPVLGGVICIIVGIIIDRSYWKPRIYRYADREIVKTLEYQKNKIEQLERDIIDRDHIISDFRGHMKIARKSALTIIGVTEK